MTCQHMNRNVVNSRPRLLGGMRSTYRTSICKDCGHRWSSYELERDQLVTLVEQVNATFLAEIRDAIGRKQSQSIRSAVLGWFDAERDEP